MSNDTFTPLSDEEVVALAKSEFEKSREDNNQRAVAATPAAPPELKQQQMGITIDLGHKNIARLPEEVIDVIRAEIERLALSHNLLNTLPLRLIECKRLRYLNVRYNAMREIPEAILRLTSLEILDVSVNKLTSIPKEIANLTSLKVLAIQKNKIEELPVSLGEITSLTVLKLDRNPIKFPPQDVHSFKDKKLAPATDNEKDQVIASQVKKYMKQYKEKQEKEKAESEKIRIESSEGEESESNVETPRPSKRTNGGRFPVRPSISGLETLGENVQPSPGVPPPIPTRSHFRVNSTQNNSIPRRPPVSPLLLANGNERNRSQSEGTGGAVTRAKRMGIYTKQTSELGSVDELRKTNHFRGFSQGYVQSNNSLANGMSGPATAIGYGDTGTVRSLANRPLSDVREHKRGSRAPDVMVEAAKNFLYSISQLHDSISHMLRSLKRTDRTKEGMQRKEDFFRRFSATYLHIRALSQLLHRFDTLAEEDEEEAEKLSRAIYSYTLKCLDLFMYINFSIAENRAEITQNADPRLVRTFLFLQQGSLIEMRNACTTIGAEFRDSAVVRRRPTGTDSLATVRASRPLKTRRFQTSPPSRNGYQAPPPVILHSNDNSRTNTLTTISAATPRSGESFSTLSTSMSRSNTLTSSFDEADEDVYFEKIYAKLKAACESCGVSMPQVSKNFQNLFDILRKEVDSEDTRLKLVGELIDKSAYVERMTYPLNKRLAQMQLKDSYARSQPDFWQQCHGFLQAWSDLASATSDLGRGPHRNMMSPEVKQLMKPLHRVVKDASVIISNSPWSHLSSNNPGSLGPPSLASFTSRTQPPKFVGGKPTMTTGGGPSFPGPINTSITSVASAFSQQPHSNNSLGSGSLGFPTPIPATPMSAALGAAAQATVPNGPGHPPMASHNTGQSTSSLNFFERADRLLSQTSRRI